MKELVFRCVFKEAHEIHGHVTTQRRGQ